MGARGGIASGVAIAPADVHQREVETEPDPGGVPARWVLKSFIIIGFALLFLQGVSETIKNFYVAMGWEEPEVRVKEIH